MTVNYFSNLYSVETAPVGGGGASLQRGLFPSLPESAIQLIQSAPLDIEIKQAVFAMALSKHPDQIGCTLFSTIQIGR